VNRDLDIVVFGATGFVGRLVAEHLAEHAPDEVRIGLAGRSGERLADVRDGLGAAAAGWPLIEADAHDDESMATLAATTRVVATTVGPYQRYGLPLVEACAAAGTHYADLTGETLFVRDSAESFHDLAAATGARIVHACGFDSIPSDLGVLLVHERALADGAGELTATTLELVSVSGGVSGGTIDSMRAQVEAMTEDADARRVLADPYALSPDRAAEPDLGDESDRLLPGPDPHLGRWVAPFVMAPFNTRIVRRSNALQGWPYGKEFRYREVMGVGSGALAPVKAGAVATGLGAAAAGMAFKPTRTVLDRVLPSPGEGPGQKTRERGHFRVDVHTRTTSGAEYTATIAAQGDPGYQATSVMLGQTALCLALDGDRPPEGAGVLTPATGVGLPLVERLRTAGFRCSVTARGAGAVA
jgi:short subunit dehydrogenase-like uncharacterized protein